MPFVKYSPWQISPDKNIHELWLGDDDIQKNNASISLNRQSCEASIVISNANSQSNDRRMSRYPISVCAHSHVSGNVTRTTGSETCFGPRFGPRFGPPNTGPGAPRIAPGGSPISGPKPADMNLMWWLYVLPGKNKSEKTTVGSTINTVRTVVIITKKVVKYRSFII